MLTTHESGFFFKGEYPAMSKVFVDERDTFLAYSLKQASEAPLQNGSDGGLSEPPVIVGVVGIGHVNGIVQKFNNVCSTDVAKVIQLPATSQSSKYIKLAIKGVVWTVAAYGIFKVFRKPGSHLISTYVEPFISRTIPK